MIEFGWMFAAEVQRLVFGNSAILADLTRRAEHGLVRPRAELRIQRKHGTPDEKIADEEVPEWVWGACLGDRRWRQVKLDWGTSSLEATNIRDGGQLWSHIELIGIMFPIEQVQMLLPKYKLVPISNEIAPDDVEVASAPTPSDRTGAPGAPSSMHLFERMMRDRFEANEFRPTLQSEAEELEKLFRERKDYAHLRPVKAKTIKNNLGGLYRILLADARNSARK